MNSEPWNQDNLMHLKNISSLASCQVEEQMKNKSFVSFHNISENCGRGYDLRTATGLQAVVGGKQGHAPCKTSS